MPRVLFGNILSCAICIFNALQNQVPPMKDVQVDEQQSLQDSCKMIEYVFASIVYIREFFPDETFEDGRCWEMSLKKIRRGVNTHADRLVDWIDKGCLDALQRKYLETITLAVFANPEEPDTIVESYTFAISYPSSREHELIKSLRATANLTVKTGGEEKTIISADPSVPFSQQIVKILRTLCIMMQTLNPLPMKRYASMQITYYDELTPPNYEPPGFTSAVFDVGYLFKKPTLKHDFGSVHSGYHMLGLALETAVDSIAAEKNAEMADVPRAKAIDEAAIDSQPTIVLSQLPVIKGLTQDTIVPELPEGGLPSKKVDPMEDMEREDKLNEQTKPVAIKPICLCGDDENDLDMIMCDQCNSWQHTPCAGYCTNKDKRIPEKYVCFNCEHHGNSKLLRNLQDLASLRRAISVVYSEGLESIRWFSKRLGCGVAKASKLIRRLENEGLIGKPNSQARINAYTVYKTAEAKEKIRHFFSLDLSVFSELAGYLKGKGDEKNNLKRCKQLISTTNATKRRKSVSTEKVSCN